MNAVFLFPLSHRFIDPSTRVSVSVSWTQWRVRFYEKVLRARVYNRSKGLYTRLYGLYGLYGRGCMVAAEEERRVENDFEASYV